MWKCKQCAEAVSTRYQLLKHYKLEHSHFGQRLSIPCTYYDCPCSFKSWNALKTHLSRCHGEVSAATNSELVTFTCILCPASVILSSREYFSHINTHLKRYETVSCVFQNCSFQTNIYTTFKTHKSRNHGPCTVKDFKVELVKSIYVNHEDRPSEELPSDVAKTGFDKNAHDFIETDTDNERLEDRIQKFASVILKFGNFLSHVPSTAIDEFLEELHFIFSSAVVPISNSTANDVFKKHDIHVDNLVIDELTPAISTHNPLVKAIAKDGPIASAFKRKQYYKKHFKVVEPVEYVLEARSNKSYQYVPLLKSLQQLLGRNDVVDTHTTCSLSHQKYVSFQDDFEVCNPLGMSRKEHKLSVVYWILGNFPSGSSSTLSSICLALLCKSEYVKEYGYKKIFEPLLHDIVTLEQQGLFIPQLGTFIKGTVQCVVADNLGAHGLTGFVESFSGTYFLQILYSSELPHSDKGSKIRHI